MFRDCRRCGERGFTYDLIKYSVRHYAHARCLNEDDLKKLPEWMRRRAAEILEIEGSLEKTEAAR